MTRTATLWSAGAPTCLGGQAAARMCAARPPHPSPAWSAERGINSSRPPRTGAPLAPTAATRGQPAGARAFECAAFSWPRRWRVTRIGAAGDITRTERPTRSCLSHEWRDARGCALARVGRSVSLSFSPLRFSLCKYTMSECEPVRASGDFDRQTRDSCIITPRSLAADAVRCWLAVALQHISDLE